MRKHPLAASPYAVYGAKRQDKFRQKDGSMSIDSKQDVQTAVVPVQLDEQERCPCALVLPKLEQQQ
ncbi:MAG: hypothetical protein QM296_09370, partial [Bacillota bacterium]|nr:hypothetical protein [Bacillota bacterium]